MLIGIGPGYRVDGRYELGERLGKGTYGEVWRAQEWLGGDYIGDVALKLCEAEQADLRQRLVREAQAMAQLAHPQLVAYRGCGLLEDRLFYLVMELADTSLEALLRTEGPQNTEVVAACIRDAARALAHIHGRNAVHRDVKPANLLRVGGQWKLGDMGLARAVSGQMQTASGAWGSPIYMAPEQAAGHTDRASDVYALGVTAQEALAGVLPYSASTPLELAAMMASTPPMLAADLEPPWDVLIPLMLSREPSDRPTAEVVVQTLKDGAAGVNQAARRMGRPASPPQVRPRGPLPPHPTPDSSRDAQPPTQQARGTLAESQFRLTARAVLVEGALTDSKRQELVEAARDLGLSSEQATRIAREEQERQRGTYRGVPSSGASAPAPIDKLASHLGNRGPRFGAGMTPSRLGWGPDDQPHPSEFVVNPADLAEMVWVPAGSFRMGSTDTEIDALWGVRGWEGDARQWTRHEQPAHKAVISRGLWLYRHTVTNGQYGRFLEQAKRHPHPWWSEFRDHQRLPVNLVTWSDGVAYAKWAGGALPTEAQWEYAARGPQNRLFPWGNEWDRTKCACPEFHAQRALSSVVAWEAWHQSIGARKDGGAWSFDGNIVLKHLCEVGSFPQGASWCGALDMSGNVWEWCADWYGADWYRNPSTHDPTGPSTGDARVMRGGSWYDNVVSCRSAARDADTPIRRDADLGLRVAVPLAP